MQTSVQPAHAQRLGPAAQRGHGGQNGLAGLRGLVVLAQSFRHLLQRPRLPAQLLQRPGARLHPLRLLPFAAHPLRGQPFRQRGRFLRAPAAMAQCGLFHILPGDAVCARAEQTVQQPHGFFPPRVPAGLLALAARAQPTGQQLYRQRRVRRRIVRGQRARHIRHGARISDQHLRGGDGPRFGQRYARRLQQPVQAVQPARGNQQKCQRAYGQGGNRLQHPGKAALRRRGQRASEHAAQARQKAPASAQRAGQRAAERQQTEHIKAAARRHQRKPQQRPRGQRHARARRVCDGKHAQRAERKPQRNHADPPGHAAQTEHAQQQQAAELIVVGQRALTPVQRQQRAGVDRNQHGRRHRAGQANQKRIQPPRDKRQRQKHRRGHRHGNLPDLPAIPPAHHEQQQRAGRKLPAVVPGNRLPSQQQPQRAAQQRRGRGPVQQQKRAHQRHAKGHGAAGQHGLRQEGCRSQQERIFDGDLRKHVACGAYRGFQLVADIADAGPGPSGMLRHSRHHHSYDGSV